VPHYRHAGDKGERKHSSYSLLTLALDGDEMSASCHGCALTPGKGPPVLVWTQRLEKESFASAGD
jgi:hypothetical protein